MELEEIKNYIEQNIGNEDVADYIKGFSKVNDIDLELIKTKIENDTDVKSYIDSIKDKHAGKSLETWKANNLESYVDLEIKKRYPDADPKDIELQKLQVRIEAMEKEKTHEKLKNVALKTATEKGLPIELVDYFIADNEEKTLSNLSTLESVFGTKIEAGIKGKLKDNSYTPPKSNGEKKFTVADLPTMTPQQINDFFDKK